MSGKSVQRSLLDLSVKEFIAETKSDSPAPGGGSVSALAGALSASLSIMAAALTIKSEKYIEVKTDAEHIAAKAEALLSELSACVDEDTAAFNGVMAAYALPKSADDEKAARSAAIQAALKTAAELPLKTVRACAEAAELAVEIMRKGNRNCSSDAAVAARMAYAGMKGAVANVRINLASIKDEAFRAAADKELAAAAERGEAARRALEETE